MINVDLNYFDCTSLDTEKFLEVTLGDPIELDSPLMETFGLEPGDWLSIIFGQTISMWRSSPT